MNFVTAIQPDRDLFIGRCLFENDNFTRIEPLQIKTAQGWADLPNRQTLFPPIGNVFAFERAAQRCPEGTLRLFKVQPNTRPRPDLKHDNFIAVDVQEPVEVFDLTSLGNAEAARRAIVEEGVVLPAQAPADVLFRVGKDECVRLHLIQDPVTRRWLPSDVAALESIPILDFSQSYADGPNVNGRQFVVPGVDEDVVLRREDWSPDSNFLRYVLRTLQRRSAFQAGGQLHELGQRVVRQLSLELRNGGALSGDPDTDERMLRRLASFLPGLDKKLDAAQSIADELLRSPAVLAELANERQQLRERIQRELRLEIAPIVQSHIEEELAASIAKKDAAEREAAVAVTRVDALRNQLRDLEKACDAQRTVLAGEVGKMLGPISDIVKLSQLPASSNGSVPASPPWIEPTAKESKAVRLTELANILSRAAKQAALSETRLFEFDVLLRSGEVPLLFGSHAETLLRVYSNTVCGGLLWRTPIDATFISLDDLWRQADTSQLTGFAMAWRAAKSNGERLCLIVLDDLDFASVGRWFPRLCSLLGSNVRPNNLLVAATVGAVRNQPLPPFECLVTGFPFEIENPPSAVPAALKGELLPFEQILMQLVPPFLGPASVDHAAEVMQLLDLNISLEAAKRAARVYRTALGTMPAGEALTLAKEVAQLISDPAIASQSHSANFKSFAKLAALSNVHQLN